MLADKDSDISPQRRPSTGLGTLSLSMGRRAEYAEEVLFAQSGDDDWAKTYSSNLSNVFVCRRLPTNNKFNSLRPLRLCGNILEGILSVSICVNLQLIVFDSLVICAFLFPFRG